MKTSLSRKLALGMTIGIFAVSSIHAQRPSASPEKSAASQGAAPAATPTAVTTTTGGTKGTIPMFSSASSIENSTLYYNATGLGIGRFPSQMLDVNGNSVFRGYMQVSRTADATPSAGTKSYPIQFNLQVYNSSRGLALNPFFDFQAEPTGNNTANTGATLNLLYFGGVGPATASETGLYFNSNGVIHFASAQTFPITTGATGPQGPAGPQGPTGPQGPAGPQGSSGGLTLPYGASQDGNGNTLFTIANTGTMRGDAIRGLGADAMPGVKYSKGGRGITAQGGQAGSQDGVESFGGDGVSSFGGYAANASGSFGGDGGNFAGGSAASGSYGGNGLEAYGGSAADPYSGGPGIYAQPGTPNAYAAILNGNVSVAGNLSKAGGSFKIDHPLDPANRYLSHSFVESPDMMNIYNGTVVTDGRGEAVVTMPDYFEALNRDFRYQLTTIGSFSRAMVASKIVNGRFVVRTEEANVEVSWQVTGVRQDAWANAHRIPVEEVKTEAEKGHYTHPELFGHKGEPSIAAMRSSRAHLSGDAQQQLHQE